VTFKIGDLAASDRYKMFGNDDLKPEASFTACSRSDIFNLLSSVFLLVVIGRHLYADGICFTNFAFVGID